MITMENTRELIDFEYYGKSYRMAPEEIEAAYRYQEMQYRKADALRMLTSYAFGMKIWTPFPTKTEPNTRKSLKPVTASPSRRLRRASLRS